MPNTVTFVAFVELTPEKEFCAHFPNFPELRARAATIEDLASRGGRVLQAHVEKLLGADEEMPRAISVEEVKEDGRYRHGLLLTIDVEVRRPGSCRPTP